MQDSNLNQLKLKVNDTYKEDEKVTTNFEPSEDSDVINKAHLDGKLSKIEVHISLIESDYNEFKLKNNKQSVERFLIEKAAKTTVQVLYVRGLLDFYNHGNAHESPKDFLPIENNNRSRLDLEEVNDVFQQFCSKLRFKKQTNIKYKISKCPLFFVPV